MDVIGKSGSFEVKRVDYKCVEDTLKQLQNIEFEKYDTGVYKDPLGIEPDSRYHVFYYSYFLKSAESQFKKYGISKYRFNLSLTEDGSNRLKYNNRLRSVVKGTTKKNLDAIKKMLNNMELNIQKHCSLSIKAKYFIYL